MALPIYKNYDPDRVKFTWNGILIAGYAEGSMIVVERNTDAFSQVVGAQGGVVDVRSRDKTGIVTFRLLAASPANDLLSAAHRADELTGFGYGPMLVKEINGTSFSQCAFARIRKHPNMEFAQEHSPREWVLSCPLLEMSNGGLLL